MAALLTVSGIATGTAELATCLSLIALAGLSLLWLYQALHPPLPGQPSKRKLVEGVLGPFLASLITLTCPQEASKSHANAPQAQFSFASLKREAESPPCGDKGHEAPLSEWQWLMLLIGRLLSPLTGWRSWPPGPWAPPLIGHLPLIHSTRSPHALLADVASVYGPVMGLRVGTRRTVVISSVDGAREVLKGAVDQACASRPPLLTWQLLSHGGQDIALAPRGPRHTAARRLSTMHLFSARRMEAWRAVRDEEVAGLLLAVKEEAEANGGIVNIRPHIARTSLNNIMRMVCGKRYHFNRPGKPDTFADEVTSVVFKVAGILSPFNYVDHVPGWAFLEQRVLKAGASLKCAQLAPKLNSFFCALLQEHRRRREQQVLGGGASGGGATGAGGGAKYPNVNNAAAYTPKEEPKGGKGGPGDPIGSMGASEEQERERELERERVHAEAERDFTDVLLTMQEEERNAEGGEGGHEGSATDQGESSGEGPSRGSSISREYSLSSNGSFRDEASQSGREAWSREGRPRGKQDALSDEEIMALLQDMVVAGTDTSAATVEWALAELIRNPDVQRKLQEELDRAAKEASSVAMEASAAAEEASSAASTSGTDRSKANEDGACPTTELLEVSWKLMDLPYLQAVVKETLRLHPPGTFLMPHYAEEDCRISRGRYRIPRGAMVLVNAWAISRDSAIWHRPNEFIPERFLDASFGGTAGADMKGTDFRLLPFGSGRRGCVGLRLGHALVSLMLARLVHAFEWRAEGARDVNMDELYGLATRKEQALTAIVLPRHSSPQPH